MKDHNKQRIKAGFLGQRMVVLPKKIIEMCESIPLINSLYFTDIGYFPRARNHFVERKNGSQEFVLIYCHKGEGKLSCRETEYLLTPNTYYIIPPHISHSYKADHKNPWSIYWIHFTGKNARFLYDKFQDVHRTADSRVLFVERRLNLFENILDVLEDGYSTENIQYVNLSLWQLLNSFLFQEYFVEVGNLRNENNITNAIIDYMKENLDQNLKIEELADRFNYSSSYFFSLFKKKTGSSPINYFNDLKIQRACHHLSFTSLSIKEISYMLGFNDSLYFSRLFKKTMGIPPLEYRKTYQH